jgi:hypothetical protein
MATYGTVLNCKGYLLLTYGGRAGYGREPLKKDDRRVASSVRPRQFS